MIDWKTGRWRYSSDLIYMGDKKVKEIWMGNKKIYPEDGGSIDYNKRFLLCSLNDRLYMGGFVIGSNDGFAMPNIYLMYYDNKKWHKLPTLLMKPANSGFYIEAYQSIELINFNNHLYIANGLKFYDTYDEAYDEYLNIINSGIRVVLYSGNGIYAIGCNFRYDGSSLIANDDIPLFRYYTGGKCIYLRCNGEWYSVYSERRSGDTYNSIYKYDGAEWNVVENKTNLPYYEDGVVYNDNIYVVNKDGIWLLNDSLWELICTLPLINYVFCIGTYNNLLHLICNGSQHYIFDGSAVTLIGTDTIVKDSELYDITDGMGCEYQNKLHLICHVKRYINGYSDSITTCDHYTYDGDIWEKLPNPSI